MSTTSDFDTVQPGQSRPKPAIRFMRNFAVGITGVAVILIGIPLIPLIGPGWLIVFTGLAILATEFAWAGRLRDRIRDRMRRLLGTTPTEDDA